MTQFKDGAGNRFNLMTPQQIVGLLTNTMNNKKIASTFIKLLPEAGMSGNLKYRPQDTCCQVIAKTGTMHDISTFAGYIFRPGKSPIIFAIMSNQITTNINNIKDFEDSLIKEIISNQYS